MQYLNIIGSDTNIHGDGRVIGETIRHFQRLLTAGDNAFDESALTCSNNKGMCKDPGNSTTIGTVTIAKIMQIIIYFVLILQMISIMFDSIFIGSVIIVC